MTKSARGDFFNAPSLFTRMVGFDPFEDYLNTNGKSTPTYPPYNMIKETEDAYVLQFAVAGFSQEEIDVIVENEKLTIESVIDKTGDEIDYVHRGIAKRQFKLSFALAPHMKVTDATLINGMLEISLVREIPEELQPKKIEIGTKKLLDVA